MMTVSKQDSRYVQLQRILCLKKMVRAGSNPPTMLIRDIVLITFLNQQCTIKFGSVCKIAFLHAGQIFHSAYPWNSSSNVLNIMMRRCGFFICAVADHL